MLVCCYLHSEYTVYWACIWEILNNILPSYIVKLRFTARCTIEARWNIWVMRDMRGPIYMRYIGAPLPPEAGPRCACAWFNHISHTSHSNSSSVHTYIHTYILDKGNDIQNSKSNRADTIHKNRLTLTFLFPNLNPRCFVCSAISRSSMYRCRCSDVCIQMPESLQIKYMTYKIVLTIDRILTTNNICGWHIEIKINSTKQWSYSHTRSKTYGKNIFCLWHFLKTNFQMLSKFFQDTSGSKNIASKRIGSNVQIK